MMSLTESLPSDESGMAYDTCVSAPCYPASQQVDAKLASRIAAAVVVDEAEVEEIVTSVLLKDPKYSARVGWLDFFRVCFTPMWKFETVE